MPAGTLEERIDEMIVEKRKLADDILAGDAEVNLIELSDEALTGLVRLDVTRAASWRRGAARSFSACMVSPSPFAGGRMSRITYRRMVVDPEPQRQASRSIIREVAPICLRIHIQNNGRRLIDEPSGEVMASPELCCAYPGGEAA